MTSWFYAFGGQSLGPVSATEVNVLIKSGHLDAQTLVWHQGLDRWCSLAEVEEFGEAAAVYLQQRAPTPSLPSSFPVQTMEARPWPRFWARMFDIAVGAAVWGFAIGFTLGAIFGPASVASALESKGILFQLALLPLIGLSMAYCTTAFGNTPGKALLGIKVRNLDGTDSLSSYVGREMRVWLVGLAVGIPIINFVTQIAQFLRVRKGRPTSYDEGRAIVAGRPSLMRTMIGALLAILLLFIAGLPYGKSSSSRYEFKSRGIAQARLLPIGIPRS
ncbi:RDD family protein [Rhizobium sp. P32RR-XVIII]|uniref:RDD family protein n=1 Tax=Rhizobium sp. P32RR-XVIII TaxID=2726738 RepID=UPI001456ED7D|nr:RDD family protein [Rhizobium sp. P32RR-XVIII]NLS05015.1 RDD family protein [Rhizobium sp. P32RR-XVIII]